MLQRFPVIVELLGPSGSGKSTLMRAAAAGLAERDWRLPAELARIEAGPWGP